MGGDTDPVEGQEHGFGDDATDCKAQQVGEAAGGVSDDADIWDRGGSRFELPELPGGRPSLQRESLGRECRARGGEADDTEHVLGPRPPSALLRASDDEGGHS